ncbi:MAG: energy transducer TonB [Treponema sp.]|nr:energy transducer TonB [Treponema sp.]
MFSPSALRAGIEGRVMLELFVDRNGVVQHVRVRREEPEGWAFGEAAQRVFAGRRGSPAVVDGGLVASRFRYPISFRIR